MSIQQRGRQENKGSRMNNRAHDSPEGERARRTESGTVRPKEIEMIEDWLRGVRFKKAAFGGVNEADVWKKISELNEMYQTALTAERARYDMLLQMYEKRKVSEPPVRRCSPDSAAPRTHAEAVRQQMSVEDAEPYGSRTAVKRERSGNVVDGYKETQNIPAGARSRDAPKQTGTKVMNRTASPPKKSARPKGIPFTEVDWLDDDEDDWLDSDIGAASSGRPSNFRGREGGL